MNAGSMINRCFRHQHPEAWGGEVTAMGTVPQGLLGPDPSPTEWCRLTPAEATIQEYVASLERTRR